MPIQSVNGAKIAYHEAGHGLPVVLVHGFPLDSRVWQAQVHDLCEIGHVITPDLRGFGQSPSAGSFTIQSLADDLYLLLTQIRALPCVLGGLSMGGYVALAYERQYSSTLRGLMLIDTRAAADDAEGKAGREAMIELARQGGSAAIAEKMMPKMLAPGASPEVAAQLHSMMQSCPPATIQQALAAMRDRPDSRSHLSHIAAPTLILVGDQDVITPPASAQEMHQAIRGSTLTAITGAGHMSPMEQPQQVSRAIKKFLVSLTAG